MTPVVVAPTTFNTVTEKESKTGAQHCHLCQPTDERGISHNAGRSAEGGQSGGGPDVHRVQVCHWRPGGPVQAHNHCEGEQGGFHGHAEEKALRSVSADWRLGTWR